MSLQSSQIDLLVFPFAGGSPHAFGELKKHLHPDVRLIPVEYPGHGSRIREPLISNFEELLQDIFARYSKNKSANYAVYGHSMGSLMAYGWAKKAIALGQVPPVHLFVSGSMGPSSLRSKQRHLLPKNDFLELLRSFGGTNASLLEDPDLWEVFEPILRADIQVVDTYQYQFVHPLALPISVFWGTEDSMTLSQVKSWENETLQPVNIHPFPGGHFFIQNWWPEIAAFVNESLAQSLKG